MRLIRILAVMAVSVATCTVAQAQTQQRRIALVIGEGAYTGATLRTAANDAGLIAQALNDSGFEIVEGRDLDLSGLRQVVQDFLSKVEQSGPDTEAAIYFSGYAAQLEGDNYLLPVDARIARASDIGMAGFRVSDIMRSLNATTQGAKIVIIDAPRAFPALQGKDIAAGLALINAPRGMLVAYATAPGYVVPEGRSLEPQGKDNSGYGIYATALADQIYQSGSEADEVFKRVRLQVHGITSGIQIPWHNYALAQPFFFLTAQSSAAPAPVRPERATSPEEAYGTAIETDTISGYQAFLKLYPDHPLARRIKTLLANRREAVIWNRTVAKATAEAYWSYLRAYPRGPHAEDARRRLAILSRPIAPPDDFPVVIYNDVPPPIEIEQSYESTYIYNDYREYYDYAPPPPPPAYMLPAFRRFPWAPPSVIEGRPGFLPVPPRPGSLPPPVWHDRPPPPRVAPVMPFIPGKPRPGDVGPVGPGTAVPPGLPRPQQPGSPGRDHPPLPGINGGMPPQPGAIPPQQGGGLGAQPIPVEKLLPPERQAPKPMPQEHVRPIERPVPQPMPQEHVRPIERPVPQPMPQERVRPVERPAPQPVPQERVRPVERPAPQPMPQERVRPMERPAPQPMPQERARPIERPAPQPMQQERPHQMEQRPSSPPPQMQQERPRQMESAPPPAMRSEPPRQSPPQQAPSSNQQRPEKRRPGEPQN